MKGEHIRKSHNVSYILYHFVCPIKNRRKVLGDEKRQRDMQEICSEIEENYEIYFFEIGSDIDHVHFLVQSVPVKSIEVIIRTIKSLTAKHMFSRNPDLRKELMGGKFWTSGYYVNTVGRYGSEDTIRNYVKNQGKEKTYERIHKSQLSLI